MPDASLAAALGRIPSGLYVLSARHGPLETGMLASWVQQAGFEPPMVSVALRLGRYVTEWLGAGDPFVLNIVAEHDKALLKHFVRGFEPGEPAFDGLEILRSSQGVPVLAAALGHLECLPRAHVDSGDHRVFTAEVVGGHAADDRAPFVHLRKSGLRY